MAQTASTMLPLQTVAPDFTLFNPKTQNQNSLQQLAAKQRATVILFICNHCPFVRHIKSGIIHLARDYMPKGVQFIGINANDAVRYPDDAPEKMPAEGYPFPYLVDETQEVAKAYHAACTPDCYVFDKNLRCVYRGQFDDSRPDNDKLVTGQDMRQALDAVLQGQMPDRDQRPSIGCSIKWKT